MITKLDRLKAVISKNEILSPTQTMHIKGGADGDDLRRNLRVSGTVTTTNSTLTVSGSITTTSGTISGTVVIPIKK